MSDYANAMMSLGAYRPDTIKSHSHPECVGSIKENPPLFKDYVAYESIVAWAKARDTVRVKGAINDVSKFGTAETAPRHTSLHYYIYVY